jgi:thioredoxin
MTPTGMSEPAGSAPRGAEIIDVWAPWCGPCRAMAPALEKVAAEFEGRVRLVRVNADDEPQASERLGVLGLPTLIARRDGVEVARHAGGLGEAAIRRMFEELAAGGAVSRPRASRADLWLRFATGAAFAAIGLAPPQKWPAVAIGAFFLAWGLAGLRRR